MAAMYDFAFDPEFEGLGVVVSHLTGEKANRFTHINRSLEDLLQKQKMTRLFSQEIGRTIQCRSGIVLIATMPRRICIGILKYSKSHVDMQLGFSYIRQKRVLVAPPHATDPKYCLPSAWMGGNPKRRRLRA